MILLLVVLLAAIAVAAIVVVNREIARRANEVSDVNIWFSEQVLIYPPVPLSREYADTIKDTMEDDFDLWRYLGYDQDVAEHKRRHEQVIEFGRYLCVFGPPDHYSRYCPSLYYGVFDSGGVFAFRVWIEFRYLGETVWVLTEDNCTPRVVRFSDFRINHPGLTLRHPITFVFDELDDDISPDLDRLC